MAPSPLRPNLVVAACPVLYRGTKHGISSFRDEMSRFYLEMPRGLSGNAVVVVDRLLGKDAVANS